MTLINFLLKSWEIFSFLIILGWMGLFLIAMKAASQRSHRGHWWGKYILGLHTILQPLFRALNPKSKIAVKILSFTYQLLTLPFGIELPLGTKIGTGLVLNHTSGIVFHAGAIIGDDCIFHSGVVIGGKGRQDPPTIGNNVYIGANSVIAGPIQIGNNVTIGACALITESIPDDALVATKPATVIKPYYNRPYFNPDASQ